MKDTSITVIVTAFDQFTEAIRNASKALARLGLIFDDYYMAMLPILGGEWPDQFVLLNRYHRTGRWPRWFSGERWEA